jgi:type IV secretion system protein TrbI
MTDTPQNASLPATRTRIKRGLLTWLVFVVIGSIVSIAVIRAITNRHETAAQRAAREKADADAHAAPGQAQSFGNKLDQQNKRAQAEVAAGQPASDADTKPLPQGYGLPAGQPGQRQASMQSGDNGTLSDADRLALARESENQNTQTLAVYEDGATNGSASTAGGGQSSTDKMIDSLQQSLADQMSQLKQAKSAGAAGEADTPGGMLPAAYAALANAAGGAGGLTGATNPGSANAQRREQWANAASDTNASNAPLTPTPAVSRYTLAEGEIIPTVIEQRQNSDMPGTIRAVVSRDVYDSIDGSCLLIRRGTKLTGITNADVAIGQERMLVAMTRMRFPSGATMTLGSMKGSDPDGMAGLTADVNNHFVKIFGSTFLIAGVASWIGSRQSNGSSDGGTTLNINGGSSSSALSQAGGQALTQTTQAILQRNMNIQPTLKLAPGQGMTVVTTRDMVLSPDITGGRCDK